MTFDRARQDRLLEGYVALGVADDAYALQAARVHLGTASFTERLRYHLGLGPSREALKHAETMRRLCEQIEAMKRRTEGKQS